MFGDRERGITVGRQKEQNPAGGEKREIDQSKSARKKKKKFEKSGPQSKRTKRDSIKNWKKKKKVGTSDQREMTRDNRKKKKISHMTHQILIGGSAFSIKKRCDRFTQGGFGS